MRFGRRPPTYARYFANGPRRAHLQFDACWLWPDTVCVRRAVGHADWTRHCTYSDADRFYSYRRSSGHGERSRYGGLIGSVVLSSPLIGGNVTNTCQFSAHHGFAGPKTTRNTPLFYLRS